MTVETITENLGSFFGPVLSFFKEGGSGFSELFLGAAIAFLAYRQIIVGRNANRLNLFDKRYEILVFVERLKRTSLSATNPYDDLAAINEMYSIRIRAGFLFGPELTAWLADLHVATGEHMNLIKDARRETHEDRRIELMGLRNISSTRLRELFDRRLDIFHSYLDFQDSQK